MRKPFGNTSKKRRRYGRLSFSQTECTEGFALLLRSTQKVGRPPKGKGVCLSVLGVLSCRRSREQVRTVPERFAGSGGVGLSRTVKVCADCVGDWQCPVNGHAAQKTGQPSWPPKAETLLSDGRIW